jgi:ATP-binding cassette subfamily B (MDR/TAP) protein 1
VIGLLVGLYYNWKLGLVCCLFAPLSLVALYLEARLLVTACGRDAAAVEMASQLAVEAVANIRTVASLGCQAAIIKRFTGGLSMVLQVSHWTMHKRGLLFGYGQAALYFGWGITTYYGGLLVVKECLEYQYVYIVSNAVLCVTIMVGNTFAMTADFGRGIAAASRIYHLLKQTGRSQPLAALPLSGPVQGSVGVDHVQFSYPTR